LALAQPIGLLTCANTTRLESAMMDFGDCIHSFTSDTLHRTSSPCFRCSPGLLSEYCFLPVFILLHHPKTTTEIWAACPYTSLCRHFPIARCTFSPFNMISTLWLSIFPLQR
jgi:hypothetical protein